MSKAVVRIWKDIKERVGFSLRYLILPLKHHILDAVTATGLAGASIADLAIRPRQGATSQRISTEEVANPNQMTTLEIQRPAQPQLIACTAFAELLTRKAGFEWTIS